MRWYLLRLLFAVVGFFVILIIASWLTHDASGATVGMIIMLTVAAGIIYTVKGWPRPVRYDPYVEL